MALVDTAPSMDELLKLYDSLQTAVDATTTSAKPLLTKVRNDDSELDMSSGLSLLLLRPHLLLTSLHHLVLLLAFRLASSTELSTPTANNSNALSVPFSSSSRPVRPSGSDELEDEFAGELVLCQEIMEKVKGLESKVSYQVKKLVALAEAEEARPKNIEAGDDEVEEDPLSYRPNAAAMLASARKERRAPSAAASSGDEDASGAGPSSGVYRPPRVAAVPYTESSRAGSKRRTERKAPALLSEFASQMDSAPALESTSGLATRPAAALGHTNSVSSARAKELARMNEFEEENMTRLVTTKSEARRRIEDEESLALGFGVGGDKRSRQRRQGGLEAEMEGVLGERGGKSMWDGVGRGVGKREGVLERSRKRGVERGDEGFSEGPAKKGKFQKDIKRAKKGGKR